jgi:pimeloyl-ACP methyl ester carboxylesterase
MARPCVVLLPGAGSDAHFLELAFGPPLEAAGLECIALDLPRGSSSSAADLLDEAVRRTGARVVGGVSRGAHLAACWAARRDAERDGPLDGLLLALPAWTGDGGATSGRLASSLAAQAVRERGRDAVLEQSLAAGVPWLAEELRRAWLARPEDELLADLEEAVETPAPDISDLERIVVPTGVVGFRDDSFHPLEVARAWAAALPRGELEVLDVTAPEDDRTLLGSAALSAWRRACDRAEAESALQP